MKKFRLFSCIVFLMIFAMSMCGCGGSTVPEKLCGSWVYIHDEKDGVVSLVINSNGKATYKNKEYKVSAGNNYIEFKSKDDVMRLRYVSDDEGIYLYEQTTYDYQGTGEPEGIVGLWRAMPEKWTFEFVDNGEFKEDGYFPGHYELNEEEQTVKLIYNDHFEDTTVYYSISGKEMTIEYPWKMVKLK